MFSGISLQKKGRKKGRRERTDDEDPLVALESEFAVKGVVGGAEGKNERKDR
jgi:hypothetical protein